MSLANKSYPTQKEYLLVWVSHGGPGATQCAKSSKNVQKLQTFKNLHTGPKSQKFFKNDELFAILENLRFLNIFEFLA